MYLIFPQGKHLCEIQYQPFSGRCHISDKWCMRHYVHAVVSVYREDSTHHGEQNTDMVKTAFQTSV